MTLILSCVTPDCVFQVSDRRLTWVSGPNSGQVKEDERNKAVLVNGRFSFGYTGLAEVGSVRTDNWLANVVAKSSSRDMSQTLTAIRDSATEAFRSINLPAEIKRHAFQGVGWVFEKGFPSAVPGVLTVSNAIGNRWEWLPAARESFDRRVALFPTLPRGFELMSVGQDISDRHRRAVLRLVGRCAKHSAPPGAFLRSLLLSMRWLGGWYPTIGPSLMAVSIPKEAAEIVARTGRMEALLAGPLGRTASFLCFGPDGRAQPYGPHAATRGIVLSNFEVLYGPPRTPSDRPPS